MNQKMSSRFLISKVTSDISQGFSKIGRLRKLGWSPGIDLETGIAAAYKDFLAREGSLSEHRGTLSRAKT